MKMHARPLCLLVALALSLLACERSDSDGSALREHEDAAADSDVDLVRGYEAPDLETQLSLLRQDHDVANEGASCDADFRCDPPLRCIDGACLFPPAMTGVLEEPPQGVLIDAADGEERFFTEVVRRSSERQRGLMFRNMMLPEWGMLFVFERDEERSFWMRNTYIPLDMVFIRDDGVIDSIVENAEPETLTSRLSDGPARFVLELNGGAAADYGVQPGQRVRFVNINVDQQ